MNMLSISATTVSEVQARLWLRTHLGDGLEEWLATQAWQAAEDGSWRVTSDRDGWTYRIEGMSGDAVRVVERAPAAGPITSWLVGP
jgi:hypothetical protein